MCLVLGENTCRQMGDVGSSMWVSGDVGVMCQCVMSTMQFGCVVRNDELRIGFRLSRVGCVNV